MWDLLELSKHSLLAMIASWSWYHHCQSTTTTTEATLFTQVAILQANYVASCPELATERFFVASATSKLSTLRMDNKPFHFLVAVLISTVDDMQSPLTTAQFSSFPAPCEPLNDERDQYLRLLSALLGPFAGLDNGFINLLACARNSHSNHCRGVCRSVMSSTLFWPAMSRCSLQRARNSEIICFVWFPCCQFVKLWFCRTGQHKPHQVKQCSSHAAFFLSQQSQHNDSRENALSIFLYNIPTYSDAAILDTTVLHNSVRIERHERPVRVPVLAAAFAGYFFSRRKLLHNRHLHDAVI